MPEWNNPAAASELQCFIDALEIIASHPNQAKVRGAIIDMLHEFRDLATRRGRFENAQIAYGQLSESERGRFWEWVELGCGKEADE
jgi:hypothetical protein